MIREIDFKEIIEDGKRCVGFFINSRVQRLCKVYEVSTCVRMQKPTQENRVEKHKEQVAWKAAESRGKWFINAKKTFF